MLEIPYKSEVMKSLRYIEFRSDRIISRLALSKGTRLRQIQVRYFPCTETKDLRKRAITPMTLSERWIPFDEIKPYALTISVQEIYQFLTLLAFLLAYQVLVFPVHVHVLSLPQYHLWVS